MDAAIDGLSATAVRLKKAESIDLQMVEEKLGLIENLEVLKVVTSLTVDL